MSAEAQAYDEAPRAKLNVEEGFPSIFITGDGVNGIINISSEAGDFWIEQLVTGPGEFLIPFLEPNQSYRIAGFLVNSQGELVLQEAFETGGLSWRWPENPSTPGSALIFPGMGYVPENNGQCTLGFMAWGARHEELYALTAGHCFIDETPGKLAYFVNGPAFGEFAAGEMHRSFEERDWAAIRIFPEYVSKTTTTMAQWGGPTKLLPENWGYGDPACWYGNGQYFQETEATKGRCGVFDMFYSDEADDNPASTYAARGRFWVNGQSYFGDSGSPVIHPESGAPIGILSGGIPGAVIDGWHICIILERAYEHGLALRLALGGDSVLPTGELPVDIPRSGSLYLYSTEPSDPGCRQDVIAWHGRHG